MQVIPSQGIRITCQKCKRTVQFSLPADWHFQLIGVIQLRHAPCGSVMDFGVEHLWKDAELMKKLEQQFQEDVIVENLLQPIGDKIQNPDDPPER